MKMKQKIIAGAVALSAFAGFAVPTVHAEVAASVGAANMYYWRGFDLEGGAALIADVNVSSNGFIAGAWTSSGDDTMGTEYDLYAGYAYSSDSFSIGATLISYNYANPKASYDHDGDVSTGDVPYEPVSPGDYVEIAPFIGVGPFKLTYYDAINADHDFFSEDYSYITAELIFEKFAFKYGQHRSDNEATFAHLDATYKFNDKLSFTLGKLVDDNDGAATDDVNFVVTLSLPIQ